MVHKGAKCKPGVYGDMEARRAYRRAWMAAARARASTKSGEAAARKKEPVAAHPQKSNRAIAAETGVAFKTVARAASGVPNVIGLPLKQYGTIWVHLRRRSASTASPIPMAGLKSASQTTGLHAITK